MNDQNDDGQTYALMVLAGVVALVVGGVLTLAISTTMRHAGAASSALAAPAATIAAPAPVETTAPEGRIYFELASDALPGDAADVLAKVADAAHASPGKVVLISGFHDASGDAAKNAELAKNRALVVRRALEAIGVPADRLVMDKPALTAGGADAREARRVEMRLR